MQREIKFRAWDMDENKMIYPTLQHNEKFVMQLNCSYMGEFNGKSYDTVKMPIMQFTGLHDKNGKEIYEGDAFRSIRGILYIITWENGGFIGKGYNSHFEMRMSKLSKEETHLGNIYENPELL